MKNSSSCEILFCERTERMSKAIRMFGYVVTLHAICCLSGIIYMHSAGNKIKRVVFAPTAVAINNYHSKKSEPPSVQTPPCKQNTPLPNILLGFIQIKSSLRTRNIDTENRVTYLLRFVFQLQQQGHLTSMHVLKDYTDNYQNVICQQSQHCTVHATEISERVLSSPTHALKLLRNETDVLECMHVRQVIIVYSDAILDDLFAERVKRSSAHMATCLEPTETFSTRGVCRAFVYTNNIHSSSGVGGLSTTLKTSSLM